MLWRPASFQEQGVKPRRATVVCGWVAGTAVPANNAGRGPQAAAHVAPKPKAASSTPRTSKMAQRRRAVKAPRIKAPDAATAAIPAKSARRPVAIGRLLVWRPKAIAATATDAADAAVPVPLPIINVPPSFATWERLLPGIPAVVATAPV